MKIRSYSELVRFKTLKERFEYLKLTGTVGESTFGFDRYLNQILYRSKRWRSIRDEVISRDNGWDLGVEGILIGERIIVHHMNPITIRDVEEGLDEVFIPEFLISAAPLTHNAIHFSDDSLLPKPIIERKSGDTCPWRRGKEF